MKSKGQEK